MGERASSGIKYFYSGHLGLSMQVACRVSETSIAARLCTRSLLGTRTMAQCPWSSAEPLVPLLEMVGLWSENGRKIGGHHIPRLEGLDMGEMYSAKLPIGDKRGALCTVEYIFVMFFWPQIQRW